MHVLAKTKNLYELLLRFDATGKLQGAHAQYLECITEDGVTIQSAPGPAIPLSLVEVADKPTLTAAIGEAASALLAAKEAAEAAQTAAEAKATEAEAARDEALAKVASVAGLLARVAELEEAAGAFVPPG